VFDSSHTWSLLSPSLSTVAASTNTHTHTHTQLQAGVHKIYEAKT